MSAPISIVLPAFNEADNIVQATREILSYCLQAGIEYEVIIINDGSLDATGSLADRLAEESSVVRVIHHSLNEGYGQALRNGFAAAKYDLVFFTDSDRQFNIHPQD